VESELARIELYSQQIKQLEQSILAQAAAESSFSRLQEIYGIGPVLTLTILHEVGEAPRFENVRQFCSYCRVVPGVAQSGSVTKRGRGSKQRNHFLKWALSQAAVHAVRCPPRELLSLCAARAGISLLTGEGLCGLSTPWLIQRTVE
jgi:transposase